MHGIAIPAAPTMNTSARAHDESAKPMTALALHAMHARVQEAAPTSAVAVTATIGAAPMGCGMDHQNCVAVLPFQDQLSAGMATRPVALPHNPAPPVQLCTDRSCRAPPNICLTRLCISRT